MVPGHIPPDVDSEEEEGDFGPPDPHDVGDDEGDGGGAAGPSSTTDPLERFIQELDDLASMDGPDISAALADLPVPQREDVPTIFMQEAVKVWCVSYYIICYVVCDMFFSQAGYVPPPREEDRTAFTKSERILMDYIYMMSHRYITYI